MGGSPGEPFDQAQWHWAADGRILSAHNDQTDAEGLDDEVPGGGHTCGKPGVPGLARDLLEPFSAC